MRILKITLAFLVGLSLFDHKAVKAPTGDVLLWASEKLRRGIINKMRTTIRKIILILIIGVILLPNNAAAGKYRAREELC